MKYLKLSLTLVSIFLFLSGCGAMRKLDKSDEYKKSQIHDEFIVLPSDLSGSNIENMYPVPKVENKHRTVNVSTLPPGSNLK